MLTSYLFLCIYLSVLVVCLLTKAHVITATVFQQNMVIANFLFLFLFQLILRK